MMHKKVSRTSREVTTLSWTRPELLSLLGVDPDCGVVSIWLSGPKEDDPPASGQQKLTVQIVVTETENDD